MVDIFDYPADIDLVLVYPEGQQNTLDYPADTGLRHCRSQSRHHLDLEHLVDPHNTLHHCWWMVEDYSLQWK